MFNLQMMLHLYYYYYMVSYICIYKIGLSVIQWFHYR